MLDKRSIALLDAINNECSGSGYKIFSFEQLLAFLPSKLSVEMGGLRESLCYLANHEYISIKYQDEGEVCLRPLIKGRVAIENNSDKEKSQTSLEKKLLLFSFLGALLGGLICGVIFYLLSFIGVLC